MIKRKGISLMNRKGVMRKLEGKAWVVAGLVAFTAAAHGAQSEKAIQAPVPSEVQALVPTGMKLLFFKADEGRAEGSDAIAILESMRKPADAHTSTGPRTLIMLRKSNGIYREVARNNKIIGCSTCGEDADDPFLPQGVELTPGHLVIDQEHGSAPSTAVYTFVRDPKTQEWLVTHAVNTHVGQSPVGGDFIKTPTPLVLPNPPLLVNFDPAWREAQFWGAIIVSEKAGGFMFMGNLPDQQSLDKSISAVCRQKGLCKVLVKQNFGCMALAKDAKGRFFAGASLTSDNADTHSREHALNECKSLGGNACQIVRSDCSTPSR